MPRPTTYVQKEAIRIARRTAITSAIPQGYLAGAVSAIASALLVFVAVQPALASDQGSQQRQEDERRYRLQPGIFVYGTSFVAPLAELFGEVYIGDGSFVATNSILRAAPTHQITIGSGSNVQDNVLVRALEDSIGIADETSITHHAIVRNSQVGARVYVGYRATLSNASVGDGAVIWHGARVEGVSIPPNAFVAAGQVVTSQVAADALPKAPAPDKKYANQRLKNNQTFARGYIELYESEGYDAVIGVSRNPKTSILPRAVEPRIAPNVELQEFVRIVGDVRVGRDSSIGQRTTIRADEGSPIIIGANAAIDDRVTFHGLEDTAIRIGDGLTVYDDAVIHGPLDIGDNVTVGERAVVFDATVGDNVEIGEGAIVATPPGQDTENAIPANSLVPDGAVISGPDDLKKLRPRGSGDRDDVPGELPAAGSGALSIGRATTVGAARACAIVSGAAAARIAAAR